MRQKSKMLTVVFLVFLCIFLLAGILFPDKGFSQTENRYLQKKPEFTWKTLLDGSYGRTYEEYLSDQIPGRNNWISLKTGLELALGKKDVGGVYFGKDNYYIEKFDASHIQTDRLKANLNYLDEFVKRMKQQLPGGQVKVMLVPSASQILEDKLPPFASPFDQSKVTGELKNLVGSEHVIELEEELKKHKEERLYYKTDHHWTALGAYYGYREWGRESGITPWDLEAFQTHTVSTNFLGTLQSKVNVSMEMDVIQLMLPIKEQAYQVFYDGNDTAHDTLYNLDALTEKDQYKVFLDGNHGWTRIQNNSCSEEMKGKKLLIIKDSYAHSFAPFAANHYEEVNMVDLRYFNQDLDSFVNQQEITDILVLYQIPGFSMDRNLVKLNRYQNKVGY